MTSDLDRRCARKERDLETQIAKLDGILARFSRSPRCIALREYRNALVIDLYDTRLAHNAYDSRLRVAMEDATGQDEDAFYANHSDDDSGRYNDAGEPRW